MAAQVSASCYCIGYSVLVQLLFTGVIDIRCLWRKRFFNNLFMKFNRGFYKSTNSCIITEDIIIYNFNVMTISFTMFWKYRRKSYLFITWVPSCWRRILALIHKSGKRCCWTFDFCRSKWSRREQVHWCAAHSSTVTILKIWFGPPCLGYAVTGVPGSVLPSDTSSTWSISLLIVPSSSKCHSWLGPPWGSKIDTLPVSWFTSSTNLDTKIPHYKNFLVLGNENWFALSHRFSYCLQECMNKWQSAYLNNFLKTRNAVLWDVRPRRTV